MRGGTYDVLVGVWNCDFRLPSQQFVVDKTTGVMPKPLAALSILSYTIGFIHAMFKAKNMR